MTKFEKILDRVPRSQFWPLPKPTRSDGQERRIGVELEFSALTELGAAELIKELWGGTIERQERHVLMVKETGLGDIKIELDTAWKEKANSHLVEKLLDLSREVVPLEIVTPPLSFVDLQEIERLIQALEGARAKGTDDGLLLAFGIHLNPEVASETSTSILPVVMAFALLERWLRASDPPDLSRRVLPFINPWPKSFVDQVSGEGSKWQLPDLCEAYLELVPSRSHGLDLLPLLEHLFPDSVQKALPESQAKGGRPTYHYRLPESGLGVEGWSFAYEWNRWVLIERVAANRALLMTLAKAWTAHRTNFANNQSAWMNEVHRLLEGADIWGK